MYKVFYTKRYIVITSRYEDCSANLGGITYIIQSLADVPLITEQFVANKELSKLYVYTGGISEDKIFERICEQFKLITAAGGLVRNPDGEILMIYRLNHWDLPKGWHEENESLEQTAIREVEEECGVQKLELVKPITITYHVYEQNGLMVLKKTHWFELFCKNSGSLKPQAEENIEEARWVKISELPAYLNKAYPSVKEVFKAYGLL